MCYFSLLLSLPSFSLLVSIPTLPTAPHASLTLSENIFVRHAARMDEQHTDPLWEEAMHKRAPLQGQRKLRRRVKMALVAVAQPGLQAVRATLQELWETQQQSVTCVKK